MCGAKKRVDAAVDRSVRALGGNGGRRAGWPRREIYRVARRYDLLPAVAAAAPATPTRPPVGSLGERLGRSDGVIAPGEQDRAIALDRGLNSDRKALVSPIVGDPWRGRLREPTPASRALMSALLLGRERPPSGAATRSASSTTGPLSTYRVSACASYSSARPVIQT